MCSGRGLLNQSESVVLCYIVLWQLYPRCQGEIESGLQRKPVCDPAQSGGVLLHVVQLRDL